MRDELKQRRHEQELYARVGRKVVENVGDDGLLQITEAGCPVCLREWDTPSWSHVEDCELVEAIEECE